MTLDTKVNWHVENTSKNKVKQTIIVAFSVNYLSSLKRFEGNPTDL